MSKNRKYFAAVGDVHGHVDKMVAMLKELEKSLNIGFSFILQVGDFEPIRDENDLRSLPGPSKYKKLGEFPFYYKKQKKFPWPIYFIAGNHEPYLFLEQYPDGGEICNNLYYIGRANKINVNNIEIVGLSGKYVEKKFQKERPDLTAIEYISNKEFIYFNENDVEKLIELGKTDILMMHDWPRGIIAPEHRKTFKSKRKNVTYDLVGNEYARILMEILEPKLVLCGHEHQKYINKITLESGKETLVVCMANVESGYDSIALFNMDDNGNFFYMPQDTK